VKVHKKEFVYFGLIDEAYDPLQMSVKLLESREAALWLPVAWATGYKWGNHGWVTFVFQEKTAPLLCYYWNQLKRAIGQLRRSGW
jgi:hypothetical protein